MNASFIPVILCGGSGTRLWPKSRASVPKQYCDLLGMNLFETTLLRFEKYPKFGIISLASQAALIGQFTPKSMARTSKVQVLEPVGRNTAPAIALAVRNLMETGDSQAVVGVFPADHYISDTPEFMAALSTAIYAAQSNAAKGSIVTLGIKPTYPATGYGYIETRSEGTQPGTPVRTATRFHEKPDAARATEYLGSGSFFWNAGIFVARVDVLAKAFETHAPEIWSAVMAIENPLAPTKNEYERIPSVAFDVAIMEKLPEHLCVPADCGWSDVGSWDSLFSTLADRTKSGPSVDNVVRIGSDGGSVLPHRNKKVVLIDLPDTNVVDTEDALLVYKTGSSEKVKNAVDELTKRKSPEATAHPFEYRPWGNFEILRDTEAFKSKVIQVLPGQRLSYQSHTKRAEHWIIIKGAPEVTLNDEVLKPKAGEHIYIPMGAKHRISNPGTTLVEFVEVQVGTYFGEDDIVRYQDDYKRT